MHSVTMKFVSCLLSVYSVVCPVHRVLLEPILIAVSGSHSWHFIRLLFKLI